MQGNVFFAVFIGVLLHCRSLSYFFYPHEIWLV